LTADLDWTDDGGVPEDWELRSLREESSYHWEMETPEAEKTLKSCRTPRCYIIRYSKGDRCFKLSIKGKKWKRKRIEHYRIQIEQHGETNKYSLKDNEEKFDKLTQLLQYYQKNGTSRKLRTIGDPLISKYYTGRAGEAGVAGHEEPDGGEAVEQVSRDEVHRKLSPK
jgi:hypothetical protein